MRGSKIEFLGLLSVALVVQPECVSAQEANGIDEIVVVGRNYRVTSTDSATKTDTAILEFPNRFR